MTEHREERRGIQRVRGRNHRRQEEPEHPVVEMEEEEEEEVEPKSSRRLLFRELFDVLLVIILFVTALLGPYHCCSKSPQLSIFVTGKSSAGKSTLIYGLLGLNEEEINKKQEISSATLSEQKITSHGVSVTVLEWRSLEHDQSDLDGNVIYQIKNVDFVLFTIRMDDPRYRPGHKTSMRKLGHHFGADIWKKTIIALTFANRVDFVDRDGKLMRTKEYLDKKLEHWTKGIHEILDEEFIPVDMINELPIIPTGYYKYPLLYEESWVDSLIGNILSRVAKEAKPIVKQAFNASQVEPDMEVVS